MKNDDFKVPPNVRITVDQKRKIIKLANVNGLTYSEMFRRILNVGIDKYS